MKENNNENSKISESNSEQSFNNPDLFSNKSSEKKSDSFKDSKYNLSPQNQQEQEVKKVEDNIFQNNSALNNSKTNNNNNNNNTLNNNDNSNNDNNEAKETQDKQKSNSFSNNTKNMSIIIEKLENYYKNLQGDVRTTTFQKLLNNQDIIEILKELCRKNLEDIVVYILNEFSPEQRKDGLNFGINEGNDEKEKSYKDLVFLAVKKGQIHVLETLDNLGLSFDEILDDDGNTGLILAVIFQNIQINLYLNLHYFLDNILYIKVYEK